MYNQSILYKAIISSEERLKDDSCHRHKTMSKNHNRREP